jgi:hypothetical protein
MNNLSRPGTKVIAIHKLWNLVLHTYARYKVLLKYLQLKESDFFIRNYGKSVPGKFGGMNSIYYIIVNSKQQGPSSEAKRRRSSDVLLCHSSYLNNNYLLLND